MGDGAGRKVVLWEGCRGLVEVGGVGCVEWCCVKLEFGAGVEGTSSCRAANLFPVRMEEYATVGRTA